MIYLSDFQPLSFAKIKKFSSTIRFLQKIFSDKVHAILIEEVTVQTTSRDGASFRIPGGGGGVLPIMAYTGRLRPKGVPFSGFRYIKG